MRETLRQHLLESRAGVFVPSLIKRGRDWDSFDVAMEDFDQALGRLRFARASFGILAELVKFDLAFHDLD